MKNRFGKNVISSLVGQLLIVALGIVLPRIVLVQYGSDTNGLLATITQIFSYMALLEAGIGQATKNALYEPLSTENHCEIGKIFYSSRSYFRRVTVGYAIGVVAVAMIAPYFIKTNIPIWDVIFAILIEGGAGVVSFFFTETPLLLLNSDGRGYVCNNLNTVLRVATYIVKMSFAFCGANIVFLQLGFLGISVVKSIAINVYFYKCYPWLNEKNRYSRIKLPDRGAYIVNEIAWTMFSSTDVIVLSAFLGTESTSVYSVYNMVFSQFGILLNSVYNSICYLLGQAYHSDLERYEQLHDTFCSVFLGAMTIFMSTSYVLVIPFVSLYTKGINDIEYINEKIPIFFCLIQFLSWARYVSGNLKGLSGYARKTSLVSMIEAIINIVLSVVLVGYFGIVGVLMATALALPIKVIWCIYISDKIVLKRKVWNSLCILGGNFIVLIIAYVIKSLVKIEINNYILFLIYGMGIFLFFLLITLLVNCVINRNLVKVIKEKIGKR